MKNAQDILSFWFEETPKKYWFQATAAFDSDIRHRFETTATELAAKLSKSTPHQWEEQAESSLALILALDQFPRNMYRDTPGAFAWDGLALGVAGRMVEKGWDLKIKQSQRAFVYMPFMHTEDIMAQNKCVDLCDSRLEDSNTLHHAKEHHKVIKKFGRFPHRNKILNRESTEAEERFLDAGGYSP
ncbi:DUF924 family protein [Litorimonas sp.]|uniref:DUF924 family protein n=1 Tax=Litorimonas sp. TaxID=1892381 RepID=UPI003A8A824E